MIRFAVIADPHVQDCAWVPDGTNLPGMIRSFGDTAASTRVFNESLPAFRAALERAAEEGAKIVLLVGDLTDDGQRHNIDAALALIAEFRDRHGLRVLATPGNHDFFAIDGRPQAKTCLTDDGLPVLLTSADVPATATLGTAEALALMSDLGYQPQAGDLHWESPFGTDPAWAARVYDTISPDGTTQCAMIDASYLVEPVAGLWVLSIDANVCVPRDGVTDFTDPANFHDPSNGGWPAVVAHRGHLFAWMRDVAQRAERAGKHLVAFSHYPALDALGGTSAEEVALFGPHGLARRAPTAEVAENFAATGVRLHFSGHLHVNDTARHFSGGAGFINIAVPSPVGYGPGLKLVELNDTEALIRSLSLRQVPGHDLAFPAYRREAAGAGMPGPFASFAPDHGDFLDRHLGELVRNRYLPREWPEDMRDFVEGRRVSDLLAILGVSLPRAPDFSLMLLVDDWYRLRKAGELSHPWIPAERLDFYSRICAAMPDLRGESLSARFAALLRILSGYLARLPNGDFIIRLADLAITRA